MVTCDWLEMERGIQESLLLCDWGVHRYPVMLFRERVHMACPKAQAVPGAQYE